YTFTVPPTSFTSPLSLHDALPIYDQTTSLSCGSRPCCRGGLGPEPGHARQRCRCGTKRARRCQTSPVRPARRRKGGSGCPRPGRSEEHTSELQSRENLVCRLLLEK